MKPAGKNIGVIKGVLREELENSLRMKGHYERELAKLPKGSLIKKRIKGHDYYYVVMRHNGKVKFIYKAGIRKDEKVKYEKAKEYRAKYRRLLSQVKRQIRFLRGVLRGKAPI